VKISATGAVGFQTPAMPRWNGRSWSAKNYKICVWRNFRREILHTELPAWKFLKVLVRGFQGTKGEKLFRNHTRSAIEIPVAKMPVVMEDPLLTLVHRFLSLKQWAVGEENADVFLSVFGKNGATVSRKVESDWDTWLLLISP